MDVYKLEGVYKKMGRMVLGSKFELGERLKEIERFRQEIWGSGRQSLVCVQVYLGQFIQFSFVEGGWDLFCLFVEGGKGIKEQRR